MPAGAMDMVPFERATMESDGICVELKVREWQTPALASDRPECHHLHLYLPPILYRGETRFPEMASAGPFPVGRSFYRPPGMLLESHGTGGRAYSLDCRIEPDRFAHMIPLRTEWTEARLAKICNLDRSAVFPLLARIAQELRLPDLGQAAMVEGLLHQAVVELGRYLWQPPGGTGDATRLTRAQVERIEARIDAAELAPPTVEELARLCAMSERHLLRLFHATLGHSVSSHIRQRLMDRAQAMLLEDEPIKRIAHMLGFSSATSFSAAFARSVGTPPAQWRADARARGGRASAGPLAHRTQPPQ